MSATARAHTRVRRTRGRTRAARGPRRRERTSQTLCACAPGRAWCARRLLPAHQRVDLGILDVAHLRHRRARRGGVVARRPRAAHRGATAATAATTAKISLRAKFRRILTAFAT
eukprot:5985081-Prymnesium_polylepis.1